MRLKIDLLLVQGLLVEAEPYLSSEGPPEEPCPLVLYAVLLKAQCCYSTGQVSPHPHLQPGTVPSHTELMRPLGAAVWRC